MRWRLRDVHLLVGLLSSPLLLVYGASGLQMSKTGVRAPQERNVERTVELAAASADAAAIARELSERHGVSGHLHASRETPEGLYLDVRRIAARTEVTVDRERGSARVSEQTWGFLGVLNRLHHTYGVAHWDWPSRWWGLALVALSSCLLFLTFTGVWLWLRIRPERRTGTIVLGIGLVWGLGSLMLVWFS